jgi:VWFA-related protein
MSARASAVRAAFAILALTAWGGTIDAQRANLAVRIVAPEPDTLITGAVTLRARIEPPEAASDVTRLLFYADGRLVCTVTEPSRPECTWDAGPAIREHVIRLVAERSSGPRLVTSIKTRGLDLAEAVRVEIVQVTAVVTDRGRFIKGLPQSAFRVLEDDVPQSITHFSSEGSPLELVVAVDVSASMGHAMAQLKTSVKKFLSALGPKDQVTLTAFNDNLFTLTRRETTPEARLRAVDRLAPWGGTALYDVIIRGLQQLSTQPGRRVLVVFSDGDDRTSHATLDGVERAVRASDATLFMVALGRGVRNAALKTGIERLVDLSGGRALFVERADQLDEPFSEILEELANQYLIGYESTSTTEGWREIRVELPEHRYGVRARQGYRVERNP